MTNENLKHFKSVIRSRLRSLGYFKIEIENEQDRRFNVIANGLLREIFLLVTIYSTSEQISTLTKEEVDTIKAEAEKIEKEPWVAFMQVNESGESVEHIQWKNLSKPRV